jgi:vesicle-associated membrane protein 7
LQHICLEFTKRHRPRRIANCNAYALDKDFKPTVRAAVHYHNVNHKSLAQEERVQKLNAKICNLQQIMGRNIDLLLERGENLDDLLVKSEGLEKDAAVFKKKSVVIRRRTQRKYYFWMGIYISIGIVFVYMFTVGVCGEGFQYCRVQTYRSDGGGGGSSSGGSGSSSGGSN